ncbi:MAG: type II toxin-antitoxin system VapC family toxin [Burkholderiaceae bacterium]
MTLLVDTSVWSLALRRDKPSDSSEVQTLRRALEGEELIVTTSIIVQELLQGFVGPRAKREIVERFAALPVIAPDRQDHIDAGELHNTCRRKGVQLGTIDALLAQLCIRHELVMLTTDKDFVNAASHCPLRTWQSA